jgi:hypothetical protein
LAPKGRHRPLAFAAQDADKRAIVAKYIETGQHKDRHSFTCSIDFSLPWLKGHGKCVFSTLFYPRCLGYVLFLRRFLLSDSLAVGADRLFHG